MFRSATLLVLLTLAFSATVAAAEETTDEESAPGDERPCVPESRAKAAPEADADNDLAPPVRFGIEVSATLRGVPSGTMAQASGPSTASSSCRVDSSGTISCTSTSAG